MAISTINQAGLNAPLTLTSPVLTTPNLGTPSAINLSNATALPKAALPTGCLLQVVQGTFNGAYTNSTNSFSDYGLSATITPSSATSKILVTVNYTTYIYNGGADVAFRQRILRDGTAITTDSSHTVYLYANVSNVEFISRNNMIYLDSPSTASAITYKLQLACSGGGSVGNYDTNIAVIILQEIAG